MGILEKLMPARNASKQPKMFADLDALIAEPIYFKIHGKIFEIKPIKTDVFFKFSNKYVEFFGLEKMPNATTDDMVEKYYEMASSVCANITKKDVANMTPAQMGALFQIIIDTVTGRVFSDEKKKNLTPLRAESLDPLSQ